MLLVTDAIVLAYEYAAISTIGTHPLDNVKVTSPSMIQIWSLDTSNSENLSRMTPDKVRGELNESLMKFEFGLCIESGDAWDIKWCPKGGQILEEDIINLELEEKMGIIGGVFTDGSVSLFVVPSVEQVQQSSKGKKEDRLFGELI